MKRKTVVLLLAGAMTVGAAGSSAQAMTSGYSWEGKNGTVSYYVLEDGTGETALAVEDSEERKSETVAAAAPSEAEKEKWEQWHRAEMQESLAYLKDYGVTYDGEQDVIWYQGKKVRWLIDPQVDNGCKAFEMPEGEIDVYTVRNDRFQLTGVRTATQEEFDERTRQDAWEDELSKNGVTLALVEEMDASEVSGESDGSSIYYSIAEAADSEEDGPVYDFSIEASEAGGTVVEAEYLAATTEKREEYREAGIGCDDKTGSWTWQGKKVFWLVDEDGSMYQNGDARDDKIYILVKRNEDGSIQEAKQITAEEVMAERILRMEEESEAGQR